MARVAGRDVVLRLMEAVDQLEAGFASQDEAIGRINVRLGLMTERMSELAVRMDDLTVRMNEVTVRMNEVSTRMEILSAGFGELGGDQVSLRQDFVALAQGHRENRQHLERFARLLRDGFASTDSRLTAVEHRLDRLEKKTG